VLFTIPYSISNKSILNQTIFITDIKHQQLIKPLVYILLNMTISKELFLCQTVKKKSSSATDDDNVGRLSALFIIVQCMMIIIISMVYKISVVAPVLLRVDPTIDAINPEIINENDFILSPIEEQVLA
jgi:hypothetical protein